MADCGQDLFAGIDAGTTGVTVSFFDASGMRAATGYQEYSCSYRHPGWVEQDMDEVWCGICTATRGAVASLPGSVNNLRSIGFASQRGTFVLLDENKMPISPAIVWNDSRAKEMEAVLSSRIDPDRYRAITGMPVSGSWAIAKLMWLFRHRPDLMDRTRWICNGQEYFLSRMGAEKLETDPASLTLNGMMEIARLDWSDEILVAAGIDRALLPDVGSPGTAVGQLSSAVAEETGLPAGTPICRGAGDQQCAAIGAGVIHQGQAEVTVGTAAMIVAHLDEIDLVRGPAPYIGAHALPDKWDIEGGAFAIGSALRWWRDTFGDVEKVKARQMGVSPYKLMMDLADAAKAGAAGLIFHPFLAGQMTPYYDLTARAGFFGLGFQHDRACMMRSILEGCACEIRLMVDGIDNGVRGGLRDLRLTGGGTRSAVFSQIIADILGRPVQLLKEGECTVLGAAMLGGVAVGSFASIEEAVASMVRTDRVVVPDNALRGLHDDLFGLFRQLYQTNREAGNYASVYEYQSRWFG